MIQKTCTGCNVSQPLVAFGKESKGKHGTKSRCKKCRSQTPGAPEIDYKRVVSERDLPSPEDLPAAYLKRVSDYWVSLVSGEDPARRIL